jgi:hypothetical protein
MGRIRMTKARLLLLALLLASTASCTTKKYMKSRPLDAGIKVVYKAPFDKVKRAAFDSLIERGFHYKDEDFGWDERNDKAFFINSSKGLALGSTGQYARVVIEKTDGDKEQNVFVLVETKAAGRDAAAADEDSAKGIHSGIEKRVTAK